MDRKSSVAFGRRTQQDIFKGKAIRKLPDGGDVFQDYWTDNSDDEDSNVSSTESSYNISKTPEKPLNVESSNLVEASDKKKENFRKKTNCSPLKFKEVLCNDSVNVDAQDLNKENCAEEITVNLGDGDKNLQTEASRTVPGYRKSSHGFGPRTKQNIIKGKNIRKHPDGGDVFEDYWSETESGSLTLSRGTMSNPSSKLPEKSPNVESFNSVEASDEKNCSSRKKSNHSPLKPKEVLCNDSVNADVQDLNKETCADDIQDVTVNLGVDDKSCQTEVSAIALDNQSGNSSSAIDKNSSSEDLENQGIKNTPLSQTYDENNETPRSTSRISFKTSKKSISRFTKLDPKLQQSQLQYDEYDEKIMQMVRMHDEDENINDSLTSEDDMPLTQKEMKESSQVEKRTLNVSEKVQEENVFYDESQGHTFSPSRSLRKKNKSESKSINDLKPESFKNMNTNETKNVLKGKKNKQDSVNFKENTSEFQKKPSKKSSAEKIYNVDTSLDPRNMSTTDKISHQSHVIEKQKAAANEKNSIMPDENVLETAEFGDSSHLQAPKRQKTTTNKKKSSNSEIPSTLRKTKNQVEKMAIYTFEEIQEENVFYDESENHNFSPRKSVKKKSKSQSENINDLSESVQNLNTNENKNILKDKKNKQKSVSFEENTSELRTKASKTFISKKSSFAEKTDNLDTSLDPGNKANTERVHHQLRAVEKRKTRANERNNIILDEDVLETADFGGSSDLQAPKRQKTATNKKRNSRSAMPSTLRKTKNSSQIKKTTKNASERIQDDFYDESESHNFSPNKSSSESQSQSIDDPKSEFLKNISLIKSGNVLKNKQEGVDSKLKSTKTFISKKSPAEGSYVLDFSVDPCDLSITDEVYQKLIAVENLKTAKNKKNTQAPKKQKTTVNEKKTLLSESSDRASVNSHDSSVSTISETRTKATKKRPKKEEKNKSRHLCDNNNDSQPLPEIQEVAKKSKSTFKKNNSVKAKTRMKDSVPIRRSAREKFQPFAHWRNERLLYRFEDGGIKTVGVDEGTREDLGALQQLRNKISQTNQKNKKVKKPKKAKIYDMVKEKEKSMHLQKKYLLTPWVIPFSFHRKADENSYPEFQIKRMFHSGKYIFGYIQIAVGKSKPVQYAPEEDVQLTLIDGKVEVHFNEQVFVLESKDMFILPKTSKYALVNIGKRKALLSYSLGNFRAFYSR